MQCLYAYVAAFVLVVHDGPPTRHYGVFRSRHGCCILLQDDHPLRLIDIGDSGIRLFGTCGRSLLGGEPVCGRRYNRTVWSPVRARNRGQSIQHRMCRGEPYSRRRTIRVRNEHRSRSTRRIRYRGNRKASTERDTPKSFRYLQRNHRAAHQSQCLSRPTDPRGFSQ